MPVALRLSYLPTSKIYLIERLLAPFYMGPLRPNSLHLGGQLNMLNASVVDLLSDVIVLLLECAHVGPVLVLERGGRGERANARRMWGVGLVE